MMGNDVMKERVTMDQESWFPQFNESDPFMQLEWGTIKGKDSPSWSQKKSTKLKLLLITVVSLTTWQIWKHHYYKIAIVFWKKKRAKNIGGKHMHEAKEFKIQASDKPWDYIYLNYENHVFGIVEDIHGIKG